MKISTPSRIDSFRIKKENHILCHSSKDQFEFIKMFERAFNFKEDTIEIYMNDNRVTSKEYMYLNLLDPKSFISNLNYSKNSLMYEYMNVILLEEEHDNLFNLVNSYFTKINENIDENIEFSYNNDICKLFSSVAELKTNGKNDFELYLLMIDKILKYKITKKIILFYDSDIFPFSTVNENIYTFDFSCYRSIENYNILLLDKIYEFNIYNIYEYVFRYYPISYKESHLMKCIEQYFMYFFRNNSFVVYDIEFLLIYKILSKNYNYSQNYDLNGIILDSTILSFLTNH